MTPKEKARQLFELIRYDVNTLKGTDALINEVSKRCTLMAIDEIISQLEVPNVSHIVTAYKSAKDFNENFLDIERQLKDFTAYQILWWNSVKNEIELL